MNRKEYLKKKTVNKIFSYSEGLLSSLTDVLLFSLFFGFEASVSGYGRAWKAERKASKNLDEFNYQSIKRSLNNLRKQGLIRTIEEGSKLPQITAAGKKRLYSILPQYDTRRIWDRRIYLITYDLPVKRNYDRNKFRNYIKTIGCKMLQESVWITPYNPKELIEDFVIKSNMGKNFIIVSSIGKDGAIGEMDTRDLIEKIYDLSGINEKYIEFVRWVKQDKPVKSEVISRFLLILKEDPQIPYELLPDGWMGEEAYDIFRMTTRL